MPEEKRINIHFHQVLIPIVASSLTGAVYANKMVHLQKGSVATEKEIVDEVLGTWDDFIFKISGTVSENLSFIIKED